ncbi:acetyl-CoA synthetase-like protein [Penicillium malachiteum]|uniref:acetyl-CoA synthetase-like protein n=1 Tax=Penicillium malachiteum TaxID=1324776 RepID=UPI002549777B|nr:acetyl-CoA synthetase-like protein [Penicillium malachiteum]KAJ5721664.1 acetyl-CoA synthetase-like protein [Penicillium malachiteum]
MFMASLSPLSPEVLYEFRAVCGPYHEVVLLRRSNAPAQPVFAMFRTLDEYPMGDLFAPYPARPHQFLPRDMEWVLEAHPAIRWALIAEERRGGLALLLDRHPDVSIDPAKFWDTILPLLDQANALCHIPAILRHDLIVFTDPARPLPLGVKGNPQRARSIGP